MQKDSILPLSAAMVIALAGASAKAAEQSQAAAADTPQSAARASTGGTQLGEVIVTAQRRSENLQKAAIAVSAVTSQAMERAGLAEPGQLTQLVPALQVSTLGGPTSVFYLRGVGNFTSNSLSEAAVAVNIDGVPLVRSNAIQGLFYDLDRVEVLKGPQGTLYGRNATGGAINLISAKPKLGVYDGYVDLEYGNYNAVKLTGAVNVPIGAKTAARLAGYLSGHDGYFTDGSGDDKTRAVRLQVTSEPTDGLKLTAGADYTHAGGNGTGGTLYGLDPHAYIGQSDPRAVALWQQSFSPIAGAFLVGVPDYQYQDNNFYGLYAQADWETPVGTLTVIPAYRNTNVRFLNSAASVTNFERLTDYQTTVEARLASDAARRLSYIFGVFYLDEKALERPAYNEQFFDGFGEFHSHTNSYAAFARLTFKVTDNFRLTGGMRYTEDHKSAVLDFYNVTAICPSFLAGGAPCIGTPILPFAQDIPPIFIPPNGVFSVQPWGTSGAIATSTHVVNTPSKTFTKPTYHAGLEYDLAPRSLLYVNYDTGFKSGGFFNSIDNPVFQPETITAYTIGLKNRFFDNRLQLNLEAFDWDYRNQQISHFRLNSANAPEYVTENVGRTQIYGFEIEGQALVASGTTVNATIQYLDATYRDFVYDNPAAAGPPVTGCPVTFLPASASFKVDCSGNPAANSPTWTINAGIQKVFALGDHGRVVFNADGHYQTKYYTNFEELPADLQRPFFTLDLQAQYETPDGRFTIAGFSNNVTNQAIVGFSIVQPFSTSLNARILRSPRTFGVRVGYRF